MANYYFLAHVTLTADLTMYEGYSKEEAINTFHKLVKTYKYKVEELRLDEYTVSREFDLNDFYEHLALTDELLDQDANIIYIPTKEYTMLKLRRLQRELTQYQLANISGVSIRMIQHYEQREKDINKASAITLHKLATALHCSIEDLLEFEEFE